MSGTEGADAQELVRKVVEVGLYGEVPKDWGKQVVVAKRLLKKASLEYWLSAIDAMRQIFPYEDGSPFDAIDLERKGHIALAARKKRQDDDNTTPVWLRRGFANEQQPEKPKMGDKW